MSESGRWELGDDWFGGGIPENVHTGSGVYIDSSYAFDRCLSEEAEAILLGDCCGVYDRSQFVVGPRGQVVVGSYACVNGATIVANERVTIGAHSLLAWGVVITDSPTGVAIPTERRREALTRAASCESRELPPLAATAPVVLERGVWIGFDTVVTQGVRIGEGSIVGCKSLVVHDVPPYSVAVGNPARITSTLDPAGVDNAVAWAARRARQLTSPAGGRAHLTGVVNERHR
jgi:acetyltransferase-like isoleucine patch superfamily enzyme